MQDHTIDSALLQIINFLFNRKQAVIDEACTSTVPFDQADLPERRVKTEFKTAMIREIGHSFHTIIIIHMRVII